MENCKIAQTTVSWLADWFVEYVPRISYYMENVRVPRPGSHKKKATGH